MKAKISHNRLTQERQEIRDVFREIINDDKDWAVVNWTVKLQNRIHSLLHRGVPQVALCAFKDTQRILLPNDRSNHRLLVRVVTQ